MKYFMQMVYVLTFWNAVSATAQKVRGRNERSEDLQMRKEGDIEYEPELDMPEKFVNDFIGGNQVHSRQQVSERSGKLL